MARKRLETIKIEGETLRERAINCHRLAVGAGDPKFTRKLNALAEEYEAKAVQADARAVLDKTTARLTSGHASDPDDGRGTRRVDARAMGRSGGAIASPARWRAKDRGEW